MGRKLWFRVVIYIMLFSMLVSTILMGVSIIGV